MRTRKPDVYVIQITASANGGHGVYRPGTASHGKTGRHQESVKIEVPDAVRKVKPTRTARPPILILHADCGIGDNPAAIRKNRMALVVKCVRRNGFSVKNT